MWKRLRRFNSLDAEARGIFARAAIVLPLIWLSLKFRGLRATQESLQGRAFPRPTLPGRLEQSLSDAERLQITSRMVNAAVRHAWRPSTCLEKSLALWWSLRRQGLVSHIRIGARKINGKFEAHAWVEQDGVAINDPQETHRHYAPFDPSLSSTLRETQ